MKHTIKTIVVAALVVLGAVAMAQGGGGGGGRQGGGGGFGQGRMGGGGGTAAGLANRKEVQDELKLSDDQKAKLKEHQDKVAAERQAARQNGGGGGGGGGNFDREAMMKAMAERNAAEEKAVKEILTPEQWKRLWEIWVQNQGNRAILNEQVQKDLGITDDQKAKIKDLQTKQQEAGAAMREKMQNGEIDRSEIQDIMAKQQKTMDEELGKILTSEQAAKLKEMGGKEFKLPARNGGGGRGGF